MKRVIVCALSLALAACGGSGPGTPGSGGGGVGGGLPDGPGSVPPPVAPPPSAPVPVMLPGPSFGLYNNTGEAVKWFAWWEPRDFVDGGMPGMHWHWLIPVRGAVQPGMTEMVPAFNGNEPLYQPPLGMIDVVAVTASGRTIAARVLFAPTALSVWRAD